MPASEPAGSVATFWVALFATLALGMALSVANILVNPIGAFGPPRQHGFNRATPMSVMYYLGDTRRTEFYDATAADPVSDLMLFGTSRTDIGFDTCGLPMGRVVGYGWGMREFGRLAGVALAGRKRPATLLIEVPIDDDHGAPPSAGRLADRIYSMLSPQVTRLSWDTLAASFGTGPSAGADNCRRAGHYVEPAARFGAGHHGLTEALPDLASPEYKRGISRLGAVTAVVERACAANGVVSRVVLFRLPPSYLRTPAIDRLLRQGRVDAERTIAANSRGACAIAFADFSRSPPGNAIQQARWRDPRLWYNESHFSPALGNAVLPALLAEAAVEPRRPPRTD